MVKIIGKLQPQLNDSGQTPFIKLKIISKPLVNPKK
jgi:hypothetical protein